jgi:hypothetical protein
LLVLEETAAEAGFLFGIRQGSLELIASVPAATPPDGLCQGLEAIVRSEFDVTSAVDPEMLGAADSTELLHQAVTKVGFVPVVLFAHRDHDVVIAGVAAIAQKPEWRGPPQTQVLAVVADALIENSDVDPLSCMA